MKVKSEREVTQSCLTLSDPMDCSLPGSSIHGIFQARVLEWGAIAFSRVYLYYHSNFLFLLTVFIVGEKQKINLLIGTANTTPYIDVLHFLNIFFFFGCAGYSLLYVGFL